MSTRSDEQARSRAGRRHRVRPTSDAFVSSTRSCLFRRFTKTFAQLAKSVVAVDFMESFIEKNREDNQHYGTVEFLHQDATQLSFEPHRYPSSGTNIDERNGDTRLCSVSILSSATGSSCISPTKKSKHSYRKVSRGSHPAARCSFVNLAFTRQVQ